MYLPAFRSLFILLGTFLLWTPELEAQNLPTAKISERLRERLHTRSADEVMVYFSSQADVSGVHLLRTKEEKGRFVFETLRAHTDRTQQRVVELLRSRQIPFQSFLINNSLRITADAALLNELAALDEIRLISVNSSVQFPAPQQVTGSRALEWSLEHIGVPDVWALGYTGQGAVVGGQDTGYEWGHSALIGKYRGYNEESGTADHNYNWHDAIHNANPGNPCGSNSPEPCDDHNHGTHTMGTMVGDDGGDNQIGLAPDAKWIGCRNMSAGVGTPATYLECFEWFLAPTDLNNENPDPARAPHVINNSWSCPTFEGCDETNFEDMRIAIENLRNAGIVVVVSAGNSGADCATVNAPPGMHGESFSVGATTSSDNIAGFSSRGPVTVDGSNRMKPDISAPGVSIRSSIRNNGYGSSSGTSMAGPHVAGLVALIISANPDLAGEVQTIEDIIRQTAVPRTTDQECGGISGGNVPNNTYGYGRINALRAIEEATGSLAANLLGFEAALDMDNRVVLNWNFEATDEKTPFVLERSKDAVSWLPVLEGLHIAEARTYTHLDQPPAYGSGWYYYRLSWPGKYKPENQSAIRAVRIQTKRLSCYPNPAQNQLTAYLGEDEGPGLLSVLHVSGQSVSRIRISGDLSDGAHSIDLQDIPAGTYLLVWRPDTGAEPVSQLIIRR